MKKITLIAVMMTIVLSAAAMPFTEARNKALSLSDKMAYELNLTASQLEAVYEINLDFMLNVEEEADVCGYLSEIRNRDLGQVLADWQYSRYLGSEWFSEPFTFSSEGWSLAVNDRYNDGELFINNPEMFLSYKGGHSQMESSFYAGQEFDKPSSSNFLGKAN